jgi:hypothetical protein
MSLDEKLDQLAELESGEGIVAPDRGESHEAFQATVARVRQYARQGYLTILIEKPESHTGHRYIVRLKVRLTSAGKRWRKELASRRDAN